MVLSLQGAVKYVPHGVGVGVASYYNYNHRQLGHSTTLHVLPLPTTTTTTTTTTTVLSSRSGCNSPTRRSLLLLLSTPLYVAPPATATATVTDTPLLDTTITDRVFLDFSLCPTYFRGQAQGDNNAPPPLCPDSEPMGRVVLGLYGNLVPITVSNFKAMCTTSSTSYKNTFIHKVLAGQFLVGGRQGRREKGEVIPPPGLPRNTETVDSRAFMLDHSRPGLVSLCLSENDDDDDIKLDPDYHNLEFLITTGPGPCPQLDGRNIVFGVVLQGMDVVRQIAATPTYRPGERIKLFNDLAEFLGDGRAENARNLWDRPLKSIYISDCGELQVAKPSLTPSLP